MKILWVTLINDCVRIIKIDEVILGLESRIERSGILLALYDKAISSSLFANELATTSYSHFL